MVMPVKTRDDNRHTDNVVSGSLEDSLPGQQSADDELIDRAVEELNRLHRESSLRLARRIGEYLLRTFFGGDLERFRRCSVSHVSFRRLASRDDLDFSASFLCTSVAVVEQCRQLPAAIAEQLPLSHHRLLIPVKDLELKTKLAHLAAREGLSKRQLGQKVRALRQRPGLVKRGRPALPETVKKLNQLRRSAEALLEMKVSALEFDGYSKRAARELITNVMSELEEVSEVLAQLHDKVRVRPARLAARTAAARARSIVIA